MYDSFRTLRMEHTSGITADGRVYVELPKGAAYEHGWISDEGVVTKWVVEVDVHTVTLLLPLDEISDAPRCKCCEACTTDLQRIEDPSNEGCFEERCPTCREARHAA